MSQMQFAAKLVRPSATGSWTYVNIPFSVEQTFGVKGQLKVKGTVNGVAFRSSLFPHGDGTHYMVVNKDVREQAEVSQGDSVDIVLEPDDAPREVNVPPDLQEALETADTAERFGMMSYSHRKEYVDWIESAKKAETRQSRIVKAVGMIAEGRRLK